MALRFGYNTNGFANHKLDDALRIIAGLGYESVALTLDTHHCHPWKTTKPDLAKLDKLLRRLGLAVVIETGTRFLLDPRHKHEPTLVSAEAEGRAKRMRFLKKAIDLAHYFDAEAVSFWSGVKLAPGTNKLAWQWLLDGCRESTDYAEKKKVQLTFEPEPGMFIDDMNSFERLKAQIPSPTFALTLDIGHYFITETTPFALGFRRCAPLVKNIHIEDIRDRRHEHLPLGEGDLPFGEILRALSENNYRGLINVELSRDSHRAPEVAAAAIKFLRAKRARRGKPPEASR